MINIGVLGFIINEILLLPNFDSIIVVPQILVGTVVLASIGEPTIHR
jgi:hypothetical protein